ncbi:caspase domain-containing protein [Russula dissimulans]|nr:caspase domain-containing protein [Russula dissimulans]
MAAEAYATLRGSSRQNAPGNPPSVHFRLSSSNPAPVPNVPGQGPQTGRGILSPDLRPPGSSEYGTPHASYRAHDGGPYPGAPEWPEPQQWVTHDTSAQPPLLGRSPRRLPQDGSTHSSYRVYDGPPYSAMTEYQQGMGHSTSVQQSPSGWGPRHPQDRSIQPSYGVHHGGPYSEQREPQRQGSGRATSAQQPAVDQPPLPAYVPQYSVRPFNVPPATGSSLRPYPPGFTHQQSLAPVRGSRSQFQVQDLAGSQNAAGGSHYPQAYLQSASHRPVVSSTAGPPTHAFPSGPPVNNPLPSHGNRPRALPQHSDHGHPWARGPPVSVPQPFSRRTGRKRGLVIGINYTHSNPGLQLRHAVKDAESIAHFLCESLGFDPNDVRLMTDNRPWDRPDKESIIRAMKQLVSDAQPHDSLFCFYSGHALQMEDVTGNEPDGRSRCSSLHLLSKMLVTNWIPPAMCAIDYVGGEQWQDLNANTPGLIMDDVVYELLVKPLPSQCRLTVIYDCCHSGSLLNLPHIYDSGMFKRVRHPDRREILRQKSSHAVVISLSASGGHQRAVETPQGGALRLAFLESYRNNVTYAELIEGVRDYMRRHGYTQQPQLLSSHEIDTSCRFVI